jgi:hypothetical protein
VSLFLWTWLSVRDRWTPGGAIALGAAGALMAMVREQDVFFVIGPVLDFLRSARRNTPSSSSRLDHVLPTAAAGALAFALAWAPQFAAYTFLNGHPGPTETVARKMSWSSPHALGVLVSPQHGLFFWTPLALVALAGLVWLACTGARDGHREARWIAAVLILVTSLQVYISGAVESWTVAGSFGQRRFVALTPVFAIGLGAIGQSVASSHSSAKRWMWAAVLALCIWWNLGLMAQFGLHTMDRQRLSLRDNARRTFLELPLQLPSVAWRYLTDRSSLYGLPRQ